PALQIPYELTSKIFIHCIPSDRQVCPSEKTAPLLLAQICARWREVALSTPQLWNSIDLDFPPESTSNFLPGSVTLNDTKPLDPATALAASWFTRAQGYPLSIALRCPGHKVRLPGRLLALLKDRSAQWGRMDLLLSIADFLELNEVSGPFPLLQSLVVDLNSVPPAEF
ncbi:hypothetical protein B0H19DRAFT_888846, partial [Mycena capillaripes]